jgi:hypothetical protein
MTDWAKIKIGVSNNANRRSKEAKAFVLLAIPVPNARGVEDAIFSVMRYHRIKKYRNHSGHSEWFHILNVMAPLAVFAATQNYILSAISILFLPLDALFVILVASAMSWLTAFLYGAVMALVLLVIYIVYHTT